MDAVSEDLTSVKGSRAVGPWGRGERERGFLFQEGPAATFHAGDERSQAEKRGPHVWGEGWCSMGHSQAEACDPDLLMAAPPFPALISSCRQNHAIRGGLQ